MGEIIPIERTVALPRRSESENTIAQLAEIPELASSEAPVADHDIIRLWCGLLPPDDDRYETMVNDFDSLILGTRILYPDMLHGGVLQEGKYTSLTPNPNPRARMLYSLNFVLPVYEVNNPSKVKPLPVPYDRLVSGDEAVAASLAQLLQSRQEVRGVPSSAEGFQVDTYLRVARTMRALGWDISGVATTTSVTELHAEFRDFTDRAVHDWVNHSIEMPKSMLEGLLELSVQLGEEQAAKTVHAVAVHVREGLATRNSTNAIGSKAVAAFTTFMQRNDKQPNYTRKSAIADLLARA